MRLLLLAFVALAAADSFKAIKVEPWGEDTLRIRFSLDGGAAYNGPGALEDAAPTAVSVSSGSDSADGPWTSGNLKLSLDSGTLTAQRDGVTFATFSLDYEATAPREVLPK